MTTISAKSILASKHSVTGQTIHTLLLRYPRWIHAEGRTHRLMKLLDGFVLEVPTPSLMEDENLSRNASSSRAIPVARLIQDVLDDPAVPLFWGKNQKGMQAAEECDASVVLPEWCGSHKLALSNKAAWLFARDCIIDVAKAFSEAGYHKQIVNRLLEPFSHITVVATATNWSNFLGLRDHGDAEPHIAILAREIRKAIAGATIQTLEPGQWHLPFTEIVDALDAPAILSGGMALQNAIKLSVARCASTSYKTVDGFDMTLERAVDLHDKLVAAKPLHASPCEHVCQADYVLKLDNDMVYVHPEQHGNFTGFNQYRKMLPNECL